MSKIEVDAIEPQSGTSLTLGASGDTITIPSGATITNSGTATGFGIVLQVVMASYDVAVTNTTSTMADTGLEATITPSSASNKILILHNVMCSKGSGNAASGVNFKLLRNGVQIVDRTPYAAAKTGASEVATDSVSFNHLDSPNSTSALTYKFQFKDDTGTSATVQVDSSVSKLILMEIKG